MARGVSFLESHLATCEGRNVFPLTSAGLKHPENFEDDYDNDDDSDDVENISVHVGSCLSPGLG